MSAQMLNELNERLAKLPYLGGYEVSNEDKGTFKIKNLYIRGFTHANYFFYILERKYVNPLDCLGKLDAPPIQHPHVLRWYNQVKFEIGEKESKAAPAAKIATVPAATASGSGHSKLVDPTMLPKKDVQRDAKTGQMKVQLNNFKSNK